MMSREETAGAVQPVPATSAHTVADGRDEPVSGARIVAEVLGAFGVPAVTFIPGEGILEIVDALAVHMPHITLASFRHEAGMTYAAQAIGQLRGRPGICLAARAPGALNTTLAVHTAFTDSAPMILVVGQASQTLSGREAMLNADDFQRVFGPLAKWVGLIDSPGRIGEMFARAWHVAMSGRRGPVVLVMPEDVAQAHVPRASFSVPAVPKPIAPSPARRELDQLRGMLETARRPLMIVGGTGWQCESLGALAALARQHVVPVATTYRRRDLIDHDDTGFVGEIGIGIDPSLAKRVSEADLLIVLNGRLGELNTLGEGFKGYALIDPDTKRRGAAQRLVHLHADAGELNTVYQPDLALLADANASIDAWCEASADEAAWCDTSTLDARREWIGTLRAERLSYVTSGRCEGPLDLRSVYATLDAALDDDAVVTSGAGAYAIWPQRYLTHRRPGTQLGPKSGAMGYGLAAAIGAALVLEPGRQIVAIAGDGCLMMHSEELETAKRLGISLLVLVLNNRAYGAIDAAQRRLFGRTAGTELGSIDFAAFANAFGVKSWVVDETAAFAPALDAALAQPGVKLIEVRVPRSVGKPLA
jgi:acetolactate synthase-1/2/3 large subunit